MQQIVPTIKTQLSLPFELLHTERSTRKKMAFANLAITQHDAFQLLFFAIIVDFFRPRLL